MTNSKLNGSVQALAQALSDVVSNAVEPVREDVKQLGGDVKRLEEMLTNQQEHFSGTLSEIKVSGGQDTNGCGPLG